MTTHISYLPHLPKLTLFSPFPPSLPPFLPRTRAPAYLIGMGLAVLWYFYYQPSVGAAGQVGREGWREGGREGR